MATSEFKSPTFWLAAAGLFLAICGGVYTLGIQSQRIEAATTKNTEQDAANVAQDTRADKLSDKVDAGFQRLADKIDSLRLELKK